MRRELLLSRVSSWPWLRTLLGTGAGPVGKCRWCRLPEGWHRDRAGRVRGCRHARECARVRLTSPRGRHGAARSEAPGENIVDFGTGTRVRLHGRDRVINGEGRLPQTPERSA